jgi:uncharacterized protein YceH (UPF0502 family)
MKVALDTGEARVIGVLLEKETTTPDQYPLSVNALTAGCNQKTNREPVLNLAETEVQAVVDRLAKQRLVLERSGFGSRVPKYKQLFCNTEFGSLQFTAAERAIVCELLLRGPQTPGELRAHAHRLHPFADLEDVQDALDGLSAREERPLVVRLPRAPGAREARWAHLLGDDAEAVAAAAANGDPAPAAVHGSAGAPRSADTLAQTTVLLDRMAELEARMDSRLANLEARLEARLAALEVTSNETTGLG